MHEISATKLREMIGHYEAHETLARATKSELLFHLVQAENMNKPIDAIKILGIVRQAAADLRGLKAP